LEEAAACFRRALRLRPDTAEGYCNLGAALAGLGWLEEAVACYRHALRLRPDFVEALSNLGVALRAQHRFAEAEASYRAAIRLQPNSVEAFNNLANALKSQGEIDGALDAYRTALQLQPGAAHIHSNVIYLLHYHPGSNAETLLEEARGWEQRHATPLRASLRPHANPTDPERRLRVGYVSPDFREHVDSFFTVPLLSNHDHQQFEVCCYSSVARPDGLTEWHRGHADVWRNTAGLPDAQLAEMIREDRIDILVDFKLHTANNRLLLFARKPAPLQVAWLGYPGTTGLSTIDYRLSDPYLDPPRASDTFSSEEVLHLADTFWCYDPLMEPLPIPDLPALQNDFVTFGCLNDFCKINAGVLSLWARVLHAVPQARLLLLAPRGPARDRALALLQQEGIAPKRVEFVDKQPRREYLQSYQRIDVALDPFPYNGHTTSLDALWMGVPTPTLVGQTAVSRAGWSQLCNLGLPELAAMTPEQYVALVARLTCDLSRLQELRRTLRERMQRSPLMDGPRFAHQVERAYRQIWRHWCQRGMPQHASE
jgi:predicted O-linked N-acetylglucosamine transferase (SPINDLY family)